MRYLFTTITSLLFVLCSLMVAEAQITTPGTGVAWNADAFVQAYPNAINEYYENGERNWEIEEDVFIASGDTVFLESINIHLGDTATVGSRNAVILFDNLNFSGLNTDTFPRMRFDSTFIGISNSIFIKGGGIDYIDATFLIENCEFRETFHLEDGVGAAVSLFRSIGRIEKSRFENTSRPAIASGLNGAIGVVVDSCTFIENNTDNENAAQLNLGTTAVDDTIVITNNTIIGGNDNVGGIGVSNFTSVETTVLIENNTIENNRYGITMIGTNIVSSIQNNRIIGNDIQGNPNLGGSGVNLFGNESNVSYLGGNNIENNLWGLTIQASDPDEGIAPIAYLSEPDGETLPFPTTRNAFVNNGNNGQLYALFNMNDTTIYARQNFWNATDSAGVEDRITHVNDDPSLGEVIYDDFLLTHPDSTTSVFNTQRTSFNKLETYPNPIKSGEQLNFEGELNGGQLNIYNMKGELQRTVNVSIGQNSMILNHKSGLYKIIYTDRLGTKYSGSVLIH